VSQPVRRLHCLLKILSGFLATEPIVLLTAVYISITYATLYAQFSAYPIVFTQHRGFTAGETGLAFLGIGVGVLVGTAMAPLQNKLYWRAMDRSQTGIAAPETYARVVYVVDLFFNFYHSRLYMAMVGGILFPVGLFWFAWYNAISSLSQYLLTQNIVYQDHAAVHTLDCVYPRQRADRCCYRTDFAVIDRVYDGRVHDLLRQRHGWRYRHALNRSSSISAFQPSYVQGSGRRMGRLCVRFSRGGLHARAYVVLCEYYFKNSDLHGLTVSLSDQIYGRRLRLRSHFAWKEPEGTRSEATTVAEHPRDKSPQ